MRYEWQDVDLKPPPRDRPILVWSEAESRYRVVRWGEGIGWLGDGSVLGPDFRFEFWMRLSPPGAPRR